MKMVAKCILPIAHLGAERPVIAFGAVDVKSVARPDHRPDRKCKRIHPCLPSAHSRIAVALPLGRGIETSARRRELPQRHTTRPIPDAPHRCRSAPCSPRTCTRPCTVTYFTRPCTATYFTRPCTVTAQLPLRLRVGGHDSHCRPAPKMLEPPLISSKVLKRNALRCAQSSKLILSAPETITFIKSLKLFPGAQNPGVPPSHNPTNTCHRI